MEGKVAIFPDLGTVHKEVYKKCPDTDDTEISPRGHFKLEPHPHFSHNFPTSIPVTFIWESPGVFSPLSLSNVIYDNTRIIRFDF